MAGYRPEVDRGRMAFVSPSKNVLQQTNNNVPVTADPKPEKDRRRQRPVPQETENRLDPGRFRRASSQRIVQWSSDETGEEEEEEEEERTRKPSQRPIIPNYVTKTDKGQYRKRRKAKADAMDLSSQREKQQASISIAKRNARERNRVKLVNQGFATLRSRIPDYISEIYTEEKKKKKVSKVETLRMALEYIRHLTDMLELRSADPSEWFRIKSDELTWKNASNSSTGYPSPADTEYQQSPTNGAYGSRPFYDYDLELETVKDLSVKEEAPEEKEPLLLTENAFSVSVGCCYDLDAVKQEPEETEEPKKGSPLPSITESFPKKSLRAFYDTPSFLSGSSAFHV
ncbi:UNVERIFIED_CONTAM: hypothetical protein PYX00_010213 [Menopon gallinae]|uniref:BHLH domain-containing protein n=1 Tax=Menopon gallinae TaxID=328185 RepID=A0AAW2HEH1_9NEOP